ncbi:MAG: acetyl-CoA C-acetyltransferase [Acidobacteriota bacterium]|nr:acetyl-CoA C-acetyltransferase [Acidobacteriota bacterium]|tara:strand:+ start:1516 stop:2697 length:1182 start_codon:yes stop_codon:yes gene_type:complete
MSDSVIVSAVRLPTGKFLGALKDLSAPELGGLVVKEAVTRAGIEPAIVNECIMGNVVSAGLGQNPARQAALNGGLPVQVGAVTINEVCGSGLKAVMLATQGIAAGDIEVAVAGGMESMSRAPYLLDRMREGLRLGNGLLLDAMVHDGLWCAHENWHMGMTGEVVAETYGITREEQDAYAVESHHRAAEATRRGWFADEILPVKVSQKKGPATIFDHDEPVREDTSSQSLMKLQPAFKPDGTVTAGNAPGVNDGAAAVVVMSSDRATSLGLTPLARIVGQATSGVPPRLVMMAPVDAIRKLIDKLGWTLDSVELFELNEAFSVQAVAVTRELGISPTRVNVHGGAVALGHPIGASGARILTTLLYAMRQRNAARGIAALCLGGGNGVTLAIERK